MLNLEAGPTLVVIDVQRGFDEPVWGLRNNPDAEQVIARLLARWRSVAWPVLHVAHDSTLATSPLRPGQAGNEIKAEVQPLADEPIYRKTVNSAFIGTGLEAVLRAKGAKALVLVGLTTNHCVSTTARMAGNLGFRTYVIADATAAFDRLTVNGRLRPANEVHEAALSDLHGEFATVVDSSKF